LTVAIDAGALHGPRTGVGNAVAWTLDALRERDELALRPYVISARARLHPAERRLPIPAAAALQLWARSSRPVDRWLGHPDVVHGTNYVVPPTRCPRVVSVYDTWFLQHPDDAVPDVRRAAAVLRRAVDDGAHVVTSSDATTRQARELLGTDRITTVLLGPPPPPPPDGTAPDVAPTGLPDLAAAPFILSLSTLERRKNLPLLVAAFGRLAHEHESVRLVMAGAVGNDAAAIDRAIARLEPPAAGRVLRTGPVDDQAKRWLLHHARALAYPSLDEGFGFPILEAQQYGVPVVASTAGSIPQVAGPAALLSPPGDTEALAANLFWIVTSDEMHAKLVRRGLANVERFSWADTARRLHDVYRRLADDRNALDRNAFDQSGGSSGSA
jgi:glycosyltransferase involved in cell wall biosynthesis